MMLSERYGRKNGYCLEASNKVVRQQVPSPKV
jgi:hypothetical protein